MSLNEGSTTAYRAFGLMIDSDFDLPLPERTVTKSNIDVSVARGIVDIDDPRGNCVRFDGVAAVQVVDESALIVDPAQGLDSNLKPFLLHNCLGWVLHRRGKAIFHASAANVDGICVAFLGRSGVGKSSTVAAMYDRGFPIVSGDVLAVDQSGNVHSAVPSFPRLRIPSDTLSAMNKPHQPGSAAEPTSSSEWLDVSDGFSHEALPIRTIYILEEPCGVDSPAVRSSELNGRRQVKHLFRHSLHYSVLRESDTVERHFRQCTQLAGNVSFKYLSRPDELEAINKVVDAVVSDAQRSCTELGL